MGTLGTISAPTFCSSSTAFFERDFSAALAVFALAFFFGFDSSATSGVAAAGSFSLLFLRLMAIDFPSLLVHAAQYADELIVRAHVLERESELLLPAAI